MKHLETRQLIKELARKNGLSMADTTAILDSVPDFIRTVMSTEVNKEQGHYPAIRVPGWGTFYVREEVKKQVKTHLAKRKENESI